MSAPLAIVIATVVVLDVIGTGAALWALRDIRQRSDEAFQAVGANRRRWLFWLPLGGVLIGVGAIVGAAIYALHLRPKLQEAGIPA